MNANQAWIAMFRRIPINLHDVLTLGMTTGVEIVIQKIVKLEPDFMIIRGRLAGTQDSGRIVMIPYAQLTFVAVVRDLKEEEIESIFGKGAAAVVADLPPTPEAPAAEEPPAQAPTAAVEPPKKPAAPSKSALVAKLRGQMKDK